MALGTAPVTGSEEELKRADGAAVSLPKHSYWFDFWAFLLFDVALFVFVYFLVP